MLRSLSNISFFLSSLIVACFLMSIYVYYSTWKTSDWPYVEGKIYYVLTESKGKITSIKKEVYKVDTQIIRYNYYIDRGLNAGVYSGKSVYSASKNIKKGDVIKVFYDPDDPSVSTLIIGVNWHLVIIFSAFGMIIGVVLILGVFHGYPLFIK